MSEKIPLDAHLVPIGHGLMAHELLHFKRILQTLESYAAAGEGAPSPDVTKDLGDQIDLCDRVLRSAIRAYIESEGL